LLPIGPRAFVEHGFRAQKYSDLNPQNLGHGKT